MAENLDVIIIDMDLIYERKEIINMMESKRNIVERHKAFRKYMGISGNANTFEEILAEAESNVNRIVGEPIDPIIVEPETVVNNDDIIEKLDAISKDLDDLLASL